MKIIVWFRQDLRIADNPALSAACEHGSILPLYILDETDRPLGGASRWWLHHSLTALRKSLGNLILRNGKPLEIIEEMVKETDAEAVYWNRQYEPHAVNRDKEIKQHLKSLDLEVESFPGSVIHEPWQIKNGSGEPYKVFTPFWKAAKAKGFSSPLPAPTIKIAEYSEKDDPLESWELLPENPNWAAGWEGIWKPGEDGAVERLDEFLDDGIKGYGKLRDRPDLENVSRLSPHIHFGEISPRQLIARTSHLSDEKPDLASDIGKFQSEIAWRDFANHLMFHFPEITEKNWKSNFDDYPWRDDDGALERWQKGMTGYPMVDAGMRELWKTGYMHNRVRMVVASFLVKHLRIHWREGEKWFWDTLLDADLANNTASWQWVTGSGADAAPYFRIFNPTTQGKKFDPEGEYIRKWCPELVKCPKPHIHAPHEAPEEVLGEAGIKLGADYPLPMVDHKKARQAALDGYETIKSN